MALAAFEGPAGCGKTHRLMDELVASLQKQPLAANQRVLALTYMHGSRRRLDMRLRNLAGLKGRFEALTIDSFAWRLIQRWRRLTTHLEYRAPVEGAFEETCALAAKLLEHAEVRQWLHLSFPIIVVDEAQDLDHARSAILKAQVELGRVLLAFDDFQCLTPTLIPIPILNWIGTHGEPTRLEGCRRTNEQELIAAARAVREGRAVSRTGRKFKVEAAPGAFAAWHLCNCIRTRKGGTVAVLTPSRSGNFANGAVTRAGKGPIGRQPIGPFTIAWETDPQHGTDALWTTLGITDRMTATEALACLAPHAARFDVRAGRDWIRRKRSTFGLTHVDSAGLRKVMQRAASMQRCFGQQTELPFVAMTIHQAKNREFDHVVVIWPYTVRDNPDQKRRLLYNAITRSRKSCLVLTQSADMLCAPPFVP